MEIWYLFVFNNVTKLKFRIDSGNPENIIVSDKSGAERCITTYIFCWMPYSVRCKIERTIVYYFSSM